MSRRTDGVACYTTGWATVPVSFPEDRTVCAQCPYITRRYGVRYECLLTGERLLYPEDGRGNVCPVVFPEPDKEEHESP